MLIRFFVEAKEKKEALKLVEGNLAFFEKTLKIERINTKTKNFIEKEKINIILNFKDRILNINIVPDLNDVKTSPDLCQNINEFILKFPNISEISKN